MEKRRFFYCNDIQEPIELTQDFLQDYRKIILERANGLPPEHFIAKSQELLAKHGKQLAIDSNRKSETSEIVKENKRLIAIFKQHTENETFHNAIWLPTKSLYDDEEWNLYEKTFGKKARKG